MAFSGSVESQIASKCQICDVVDIKSKCIDCDILMCDTCTNTHIKFKGSDVHIVIPLKDIGLYEEIEKECIDFKAVRCTTHKRKICVMYCTTCCLLVCPSCISTEHQIHALVEIEQICEEKLKELKNYNSQLKESKEEYLQKLDTLRRIEESKYQDMQNQIKQEETNTFEEVHRTYSDMLFQLEKWKLKVDQQITQRKEMIDGEQRDVEKHRQDLEDNFQARETENFLSATRSLRSKLDKFSQSIISNRYNMETMQYIPGKVSIATESVISEIVIDLTKVGTYKSNFQSICTMTVDTESKLWIADDKNIEQVDTLHELKVMQRKPILPGAMAIQCTKENEILVTSGSEIKRFKSNGGIESFVDLKPNALAALHISNENTIVVGMDHRQTLDTKNVPVIAILSADGKTTHTYLNAGKSLLLHDLVRSCTTVADGSICFIDSSLTSSAEKRVVKLNNNGHVQWSYRGTLGINCHEYPFSPIEVLYSDNVIVLDESTSTIHMLSTHGTLLTALNLTFLGIITPGIMLSDSHNILWIEEKGTIHAVKYSGF